MQHVRAQGVLLFLVLAVIPPGFKFYVVTRSYSSRPFLCALGLLIGRTVVSFPDSSAHTRELVQMNIIVDL